MQQMHTALSGYRDDLINEIEYSRYFVVLMAYDFQMTWKQKRHKLLWVTRFSIAQHKGNFSKQLAAWAFYASRYFWRGQPRPHPQAPARGQRRGRDAHARCRRAGEVAFPPPGCPLASVAVFGHFREKP